MSVFHAGYQRVAVQAGQGRVCDLGRQQLVEFDAYVAGLTGHALRSGFAICLVGVVSEARIPETLQA